MNSNPCVHEPPHKTPQCSQRRWKKTPTKPNAGRKNEAYYKVMRIYETKNWNEHQVCNKLQEMFL